MTSKEQVQATIRKIVAGSNRDEKVAMRRAEMYLRSSPAFRDQVAEMIFEEIAEYVLAKDPNRSAQEIAEEVVALFERPEALEQTLKEVRRAQMPLDAALFDAAIDAHPDWEHAGENAVRFIGKGRKRLGPSKVVDWFYRNHPDEARKIEQQHGVFQ